MVEVRQLKHLVEVQEKLLSLILSYINYCCKTGHIITITLPCHRCSIGVKSVWYGPQCVSLHCVDYLVLLASLDSDLLCALRWFAAECEEPPNPRVRYSFRQLRIALFRLEVSYCLCEDV